ncbi:hypothetical protein LTR28_006195 [Elasticomyces elasticus]|nr:hypothetical protein LTR28_006195 [Elasticomyces elasticus]
MVVALAPATVAQFVEAPTNRMHTVGYAGVPVRYKKVISGIWETDSNVKSFSGYADVVENDHIFFWFFEARNMEPSKAPLTAWVKGGPGSFPMIASFQELGPCGTYGTAPFNDNADGKKKKEEKGQEKDKRRKGKNAARVAYAYCLNASGN